MAGGPRDLQVESAGIRVHVQYLAGKIQTGNQLGLHSVGFHFAHFYTAGGNDGLCHRPHAGHADLKVLQKLHQCPALLLSDRIGLQCSRNLQAPQYNRRHTVRHETAQQIFKIPVGIFTDIPQDAGVQLLLVQRRFQVNTDPIAVLLPIPQVGAG